MNHTTQLPSLRERFFRRERRSVQAARQFTAETLTGWGLAGTDRADDVLLCVSELVTNALLHGVPPGRLSRLLLRHDGRVLGVEVHDSGPGVPRVVEGGDVGGKGGRGLLLVSALSDKWGARERELGKVVWCEFELPYRAERVPVVSGSRYLGDQ
ncbi:ATP-binding protein [Streptomyces longisporus]|uniref:ATP-binding protein n=1 Tax=Streptomyces longisporus TaxID=1948 RepID=UPI0031DAD91E